MHPDAYGVPYIFKRRRTAFLRVVYIARQHTGDFLLTYIYKEIVYYLLHTKVGDW